MRFNRVLLRLGVAGISLTVMMAKSSTQAQSVNLYNGSTSVPFIAFTGGPMTATQGATLSLTVGNSAAGTFTVDTGSNGILVSPDHFNSTGLTQIGTGTETLTSSGITYNGNLYQTTVGINSVSGG